MAKAKGVWKVKVGEYTDKRNGTVHATVGLWQEENPRYTQGRPLAFGYQKWAGILEVMSVPDNVAKLKKWVGNQEKAFAKANAAANVHAEKTGVQPSVDNMAMLGKLLTPEVLMQFAAAQGLNLVANETPAPVVEDDDSHLL